MPEDTSRMEPTSLAQGDRLYQGFPDFSAWGPLPPADVDLWSQFAASLEDRRREASPETLKAAVEVAVRAAALDTGAIEGLYPADRGFTRAVAVQGLAWQQMIEERGAGVRELFEAQLAAYELVLDAVTHKLPITEAWIRSLHETLCAPQKTYRVLTEVGWQEQELPKGQYKTRPNHVLLTDGTIHAYAPVDRVPDEMHRLIEQIRTPEFEAAHPALQASYCHYAFVVIHPFPDGNGRVARALASTFFYRARSIPLLIFANQKPAYLDALALADRGDHRALISFFRDRGIDTMQIVTESLMTAESPTIQDLKARIGNPRQGWSGLYDAEIDAIGARISWKVQEEFLVQTGNLKMPNLRAQVDFVNGSSPALPHYRDASSVSVSVSIRIRDSQPTLSGADMIVFVFYATNPNPFPIVIKNGSNDDLLESRLEDVHPELTPSFLSRLEQWVQRQIRYMLSEIADKSGT